MNSHEQTATLALASIFALRMLGVFMVLPLLSLYAGGLQGTTPILLGLAIGGYGLTQALFQIPWGMLSDHYGRKLIIGLGLLIFVAGSFVAAMTDTITGLILGRALQGIGAVGSATMALAADLTRPEQRAKAMAVIGMTIGAAFSAAMVLGPFLHQWFSVSVIFSLTAVFGAIGILLLYAWVPKPQIEKHHQDVEVLPGQLKMVLQNRALLHLNLGIFLLHMIFTASFVVIPVVLQNNMGLQTSQQWYVYLPVLLMAGAATFPLIILAEKKQCTGWIMSSAIIALAISQLLLWLMHVSMVAMISSFLLFFTAFTVLEALLPSQISKISPSGSRGTAMGVYSTMQFLGIFVGGITGGWLYGEHLVGNVFAVGALVAALWFIFDNKSIRGRNIWPEVSTKLY